MTFTHSFRVRYAEVDPQKVVFNSRYLEYADILVTEFFRALKADGLPGELEFHVRHAEIDYRTPLRFDDLVEGRLTVARMGTSSMVMHIALQRDGESQPAAIVTLTQVHVDLAMERSAPLPDAARKAFARHLEAVDA